MEKETIVFLEEGRGIGGAETALIGLLKYLDKSRFEPLVIISSQSNFYTALEKLEPQIKTVVLNTPSFASTSWEVGNKRIPNIFAIVYNLLLIIIKAARVSNYLGDIKVSIIQTNDIYAHIYGGIAAKIKKTFCIWWFQDIPSKSFLLGLGRVFINLLGAILPQRIIAISQAVAESFSPLLRKKLLLVPLGVDLERLERIGAEAKVKLKEDLGFSASDVIIGMTSRVVPWKGHELFLKSASLLSKEYPNLKFLIVGGTTFGRPNYLSKLKKLSEKLDISRKVIFIDFVYNIGEMLNAIDILVHASIRPEPFGLDIVEAMSLGKAVVASDIGAPQEIIDNNRNGILFKSADPIALARALQELLNLPQKIIELGQAARIKAKERYTAEKLARVLEEIYLTKENEAKS